MDEPSIEPKHSIATKNTVTSNIAEASSGTLLVLLAENLPESNVYRSWLIIVAPTLSVFITWVLKKIDNYFKNKKIKTLQTKLKAEIDKTLADPNSCLSTQDKEKLEQYRSEIEMLSVENMRKRLQSISIID